MIENKYELAAKNRILNERLRAIYEDDEIKPVYAPFETLGKEMIEKLPSIDGSILVLSDGGVLVAVLRRLKHNNKSFENVTFACHTPEQERFGQDLRVKTIQIGYNKPIEEMEKQLMGMKFDVIIGNPPYQNGGKAGNFVLWPKFIFTSFDILKKGGHLSFVVPQTWTLNGTDIYKRAKDVSLVRPKVLKNGHLKWADLTVGKYFNVASTFSAFLFEEGEMGSTEIVTDDGTYIANYPDMPWIPVLGGELTVNILKKTIWNSSPKLEILNGGRETPGFRVGHLTIGQGPKHIHKIANTSAQYKRNEFLFSAVQHPDQHIKKVIFSDSGYACPFYDAGEYGLGHHARAIHAKTESEAVIIISTLNSKLVRFLGKTKPTTGSASAISLIQHMLPKLDREMTDTEMYSHFNLTPTEIEFIEKHTQ